MKLYSLAKNSAAIYGVQNRCKNILNYILRNILHFDSRSDSTGLTTHQIKLLHLNQTEPSRSLILSTDSGYLPRSHNFYLTSSILSESPINKEKKHPHFHGGHTITSRDATDEEDTHHLTGSTALLIYVVHAHKTHMTGYRGVLEV